MSSRESMIVDATSSMLLNAFSLSTLVVLVYDWILALPREIVLVWGGRGIIMKVVYCMARYPIIIGTISSNAVTFLVIPHQRCTRLVWIHGVLTIISILGVQGIVIVRTWAIWNKSRSVLIFLGLLSLICLAPALLVSSTFNCVADVTSIKIIENTVLIVSCLTFDTAVIILTLLKAGVILRMQKSSEPMGGDRSLFMRRSSLTSLLVRQGMLRYLSLWIIGITLLVSYQIFLRLWGLKYPSSLLQILQAAESIIVYRLFLDLRSVSRTTSDTSSVSSFHVVGDHSRTDGIAEVFGGSLAEHSYVDESDESFAVRSTMVESTDSELV